MGAVFRPVHREKLLCQQHYQGEVLETPSSSPWTHPHQGNNMAALTLKRWAVSKLDESLSSQRRGQKRVTAWSKRLCSFLFPHSLTVSALKGTFSAKQLHRTQRREAWLASFLFTYMRWCRQGCTRSDHRTGFHSWKSSERGETRVWVWVAATLNFLTLGQGHIELKTWISAEYIAHWAGKVTDTNRQL